MNPSLFERAAEAFLGARRLASPEREEFVLRACAGDEALRQAVENLLDGDSAPAPFATLTDDLRPVLDQLRASAPEAVGGTPERIGRYRIVRMIGEGGMGIVYEAEQENPRRRVAIKVLRRQSGSEQTLRRFRREAEILGRLQHPGIAQILEAGTTEPGDRAQPFIAMEYVQGRPLLDHAREQRPGRRERLELIALVCDAVHYAHQNGVVHRDLKPSNILVVDTAARRTESAAAAPSAGAVTVKILDFGVARLTDADVQSLTLHTTQGELIGTIPYMSPEQAAGDPANLDWRSDVYTLGVILYELLTGRLPQDVRTMLVHEAVRAIREDEPTPAGSVDRSLRGDIETIIAKALEKDKLRRYQSAADLAADIRRHLGEQPIAARPASAVYRLRKFARRNKAVVAGVGLAFASMLLVTAMAVRQAIVTERARSREQALREIADARTSEAEWQAYRASLVAASGAIRYHEITDARRHLEAAPERLRGWEWRHLSSRLDDSLASLVTGFTPTQLAVSPDGSVVAACSSGGTIGLWSVPEVLSASGVGAEPPAPVVHALQGSVQRRRIQEFHFALGADGGLELRADTQGGSARISIRGATSEHPARAESDLSVTELGGDALAGYRRSHDGRTGVRVEAHAGEEALVLREIETGRELLRIPRHEFLASFSNDDRFLALALDDGIGPELGLCLYELPSAAGESESAPPAGPVPDGGPARLHPEGAVLVCQRPDLTAVSSIAFSNDGSIAAIASSDSAKPLSIIETSGGRDLVTFGSQGGASPAFVEIAFSPDDAILATGSTDGSVRLWRAADGALLSVMHGHKAGVIGLVFAPCGPSGRSTIVTSAADGSVRWWDATVTAEPFVLPAPATPYDIAFSPNGTRLAAACLGGANPLRIWDAATGRELLAGLDGYTSALAYSPDGDLLVVGRSRGPASVIDARSGAVLATIPPAWWRTDWMKFEGDGSITWLGNDGDLFSHDARSGERLRYKKLPHGDGDHGCRAAVSPDGSLLVVAGRREIRLLEARTWEVLGVLGGHTGNIYSIAFSPDGSRLVSGSADRTLRVWDVQRREAITTMKGHADAVFAAIFSPDGSRIASGGRDRVIRIWDAERFEEITQLHGHTALVYSLAFSPDGRTLASGGGDATVRLWATTPFRERAESLE